MKCITVLYPLLWIIFVCASESASACIDIAPFEIEDIRHADFVFSGEPVAYERASPTTPDTLGDYGLLTVRVEKAVKGNISGKVQLYWWNSTFGVPKDFSAPKQVLIAAVRAGHASLPLRGPSATIFPSQRPDLLQIMQAPCSSPFVLKYSEQSEADIRTILAGGSPAPHNYFATPDQEERIPHEERPSESLGMAVAAVAIALAAVGSVKAWRP
jgi:hypothetical protein